ncbi:MAG: alanyl-tRNA editing protein [Rhodospirillales bacterium]
MELIFREDAYARECNATVTAVDDHGIWLDRTIFYAEGGGQPGDTGTLTTEAGTVIPIVNTTKVDGADTSVCVPGDSSILPVVGQRVTAKIDWERRHKLMRMHTAMHLLCSAVPAGVTGGQVGLDKSRLDFDVGETTLVKDEIQAKLDQMLKTAADVEYRWIDDAELDANPDLVRTMSVQPPRGSGKIRLVAIGDNLDLQPCGGTHVANLAEIGRIIVGKIENKGRRNRRVNISLENK